MIDGLLTGLSAAISPFNLIMVFIGCFLGTLSPSRLQILSTRLWLTCHPEALSSAVILR